jgi:hypothetical protein
MGSPSTTRSTRVLTGLATLMLLVSFAFGAYLLIGAIFGVGADGHEVGIHTRVAGSRLTGLPPGALAPDHLDVIVRVSDATASQIRWVAARDLAPGALIVGALWLLRLLLVSVRDGAPFTGANVRRLRALGLIILIGVPVATLIASWCASELARTAHLPGAEIQLSMPGSAFVGGLGVFVLAEIFAAGVHLRDDLEGTI